MNGGEPSSGPDARSRKARPWLRIRSGQDRSLPQRGLTRMRIVSLLPSATEIVCALGAGDKIVGVSHECEPPAGSARPPVLTRARIGSARSSAAIDAAVRDVLTNALAVYEIDIDRLRDARPDVIVTQDLCDVCAVSLKEVRAAVADLVDNDVRVVSLHPMRLGDIWTDILRVADAIGSRDAGDRLVADLTATIDRIAGRTRASPTKQNVLSIEWIDPVMVGGMWMPELIALAGGEPLVTKPGQHAPTLTKEQLSMLNPDVVFITPCGFDVPRTLQELELLPSVLPWDSWRAVAAGRVFIADGNLYFNRPGPSIVDTFKIMTGCMHPWAVSDLAWAKSKVLRVRRDLATFPLRASDAPSLAAS